MIGASIGNYVIREKIGEGGMGAVYVAEHARLARRVAVKVLLPHMSRDPEELIARFFNEAKAATDIKNQHIVDVLDFGELSDGSSYIIMEWLEGQSLSDLLEREGRIPLPRVAHIARGIGKALAAAHAHGIVHRDLKPDNIYLVSRDGDPDFVKVLDFGIAKLMLSDAGDVRTQTGAIMGTPYYMSPEQCNGAAVDQRTDVYAMGIIVYQMLTGTVPFNMPRLTELLVAHATQKPPPLRTHDPSIPQTVENAVLQALEKDPAHRFNSADAFARALTNEASGAHAALISTPLPVPAPSQLAATVPTADAAARAPAKTLAEMFVRIGVRGKRPLFLVGAGGVIFVLLLLLLLLKRPGTPAAVGATTPSAVTAAEADAIASGDTVVTRWKLVKTKCLPGTVPENVETTQTGAKIVSRAAGYPDTEGTASADGSFRVRNKFGKCSGKRHEDTVVESCSSLLGISCQATYKRAD